MSSADSWRVRSGPVVRVAGLPVSAVHGLRRAGSIRLAQRIIREKSWLTGRGAILADALFDIIGSTSQARPELVGLRRALHGSKTPPPRVWNDSVAEVLGEPLRGQVCEWIDRLAAAANDETRLADLLVLERDSELTALRWTLADPRLRRGLALSAPTLLDEAHRWLADPGRRPKPQKLLRLAKYVSRAAAKTSPYSTFMTTGIGEWARRGPALAFAGPGEPECVLELDGAYLDAVKGALVTCPELADAVRVRVNPSVHEADERLRFLGAPPAEPITGLLATKAVRECLRIAGREGMTLAALRAGLALACDESIQVARRFVDRLVTAGVLELFVPVADFSLDWWGDLRDWLDARSQPETAKLVGQLHDELRRPVPVADITGHRERLAAVHSAVDELTTHLDVAVTPLGDAVHETSVVRHRPATLSLAQWRLALDDLDVLRRFLAIFDRAVPLQLALGTYCRERFGAGSSVPFLEVYRRVQEDLAADDPAGTAAAADLRALLSSEAPWFEGPAEFRLPRLRLLENLRAQARRIALPEPDPDGRVRVNPAALAELAATWPEWIIPPDSVGCFVQSLVDGGGDVRLVLSTMMSGYGHGIARVRHLIAQAGEAIVDEDGWEPPPGHALAELSGLFGSTLNARLPSAGLEVDYPFTVGDRPSPQRIPLAELTVRHDVERDLVSLSALDTTITPLHLGNQAGFALPPAARFLTKAFGPRALLTHPSLRMLTGSGSVELPEEPVHRPRIEVGRVVLGREKWLIPAGLVPARHKGEPDAGHLLRLLDWLRANGIPDRCYVRAWHGGSHAGFSKSRKPIYIDFSSSLLLGLFERETASAACVVFEEALPELSDARGPDPDDPSVVEFLIELAGAR
ncbi:lantibiotic dehydratase [Lentzea sp. NBRC 105346]|uniref:lantibiotic dehydratase n=1 Tax=Lentzea sp. NBRC 105346 TaxID=3032205 RepID=UPI00255492EC|nr:lantibiotic dehydratase [Lentzea sp. NBRC 105346]